MKTIKSPVKSSIYGFFPQESDYNNIIKQYVKNLLSTRNGEIPMRNNYGIKYEEFLGENNSENLYLLKKNIEDQMNEYCPECSIESLYLNIDKNTLEINITYKIIKTSEYQNLIFQIEG